MSGHKRIILMYISDVSGHRNAAVAVERAIKLLSPETETLGINAFSYTNPISEKIINSIYMGVIKRMPKIWDYLYDNPEVARRLQKIKDSIHKANSPKFQALFDKFKPDAIVCTQAFPCGMVADYKKMYNSNIPLVAVLTDYAPHSYWIYDTINYYITPSEDIALRLIKKGVTHDKVRPFGIPFDPKFNSPVEPYRIMHRLKLELGVPTVLVMGGGQGLGPVKAIIDSLEKAKFPLQEIIIAGTNQKLYKSLKKKIKRSKKKILLFGYVNNIHELMGISDIIITKPGGVTTAEVLTKRIPMVIVNPLPGQEISNTSYLVEKGVAVKSDDPKKIHLIIDELLSNPGKLSRMREAAAYIGKPQSSMNIAKLVLKLAQRHV